MPTSLPRRTLGALVVLLTAGGCASAPHRAAAPAAPAVPTVRFLSVNDVYVADTLHDGTGGVARLPALRARVGEGAPVLFVLAGDVLSPSLLSKWYDGRQMVDAFDAAGLEYATFGNHEFELSQTALLARVRESRFRWISSNCGLRDGAPLPGVRAWDTVTVGSVRVGLFGLTLLGDYRGWVRCTDPDSAARRAVAALRAAGAQLVVGITHQTVGADSALLEREPGIDLILGGHEHDWHHVSVDGRLVVKADANARTAQAVVMRRDSAGWTATARLDTVDARLPMDSATARIVRAWRDSLVQRLGPERVVGTATFPIEGRDIVSRSGESSLGDLVTDAMRLGTGADAAVINAGTMRIDDVIAPGPVTNYQLESIFLFADETRVVTFPITGARLRALLEHAVSDGIRGHGGFLQVSGIAFRYDPSRPSGERITSPIRMANGRLLQPEETIRMAFDAYPACEGGDGYQVPEAELACRDTASAPRAVDLLARYIAHDLHGTITPPTAARILRASP